MIKLTVKQNSKSYNVTASPVVTKVLVSKTNIGKAGKSAYQSALDNGFIGTELEWLDSQKNIDGGLIF